jgi:hypothetical protein
MRSLSGPHVSPALVSTLLDDLPQFHHDFNTFDHLYTHNLPPLQAYLNNITDTVDKSLSATAESVLGLRLPHPHKHHDPHNLHPPPTHTGHIPEHTRARKTRAYMRITSTLSVHGQNCLNSTLSTPSDSALMIVSPPPAPSSDNSTPTKPTSAYSTTFPLPRKVWCLQKGFSLKDQDAIMKEVFPEADHV